MTNCPYCEKRLPTASQVERCRAWAQTADALVERARTEIRDLLRTWPKPRVGSERLPWDRPWWFKRRYRIQASAIRPGLYYFRRGGSEEDKLLHHLAGLAEEVRLELSVDAELMAEDSMPFKKMEKNNRSEFYKFTAEDLVGFKAKFGAWTPPVVEFLDAAQEIAERCKKDLLRSAKGVWQLEVSVEE